MLGVDVTPGQEIVVTVGAGGYGNAWPSSSDGGTSSVGSICSAAGGQEGYSGYGVDYHWWQYDTSTGTTIYNNADAGGSGGSGGSARIYRNSSFIGGKGGVDGGNGEYVSRCTNFNETIWGLGQGTTTRYFGESTGTLYSTGGCSEGASNGWYNTPSANTGDGASAGIYPGGSGICIIRWTKDYIS